LGQDGEIILDGNGYFVQSGNYAVKWSREGLATVRADGSEGYVDLGPGKRVWLMVIPYVNDLNKYDDTSTNLSGQSYRDTLMANYAWVAQTVTFQDPLGGSFQVHVDGYVEQALDLQARAAGPRDWRRSDECVSDDG
jgi:hypothetical protein